MKPSSPDASRLGYETWQLLLRIDNHVFIMFGGSAA